MCITSSISTAGRPHGAVDCLGGHFDKQAYIWYKGVHFDESGILIAASADIRRCRRSTMCRCFVANGATRLE